MCSFRISRFINDLQLHLPRVILGCLSLVWTLSVIVFLTSEHPLYWPKMILRRCWRLDVLPSVKSCSYHWSWGGVRGYGYWDYQYKPRRCRPQVCTNLILLTIRRVTDIVVSACIWALLRHPLGLELGHWYQYTLKASWYAVYMGLFYA